MLHAEGYVEDMGQISRLKPNGGTNTKVHSVLEPQTKPNHAQMYIYI